jgi:addiction module HigA family antidote
MSTKLTTKTTTKKADQKTVPQDGIPDIDGPGIDFEDGEDEKGDFAPLRRAKRPVHPGVILAELFLPATNLTQGELAAWLGVSRRTVNMIINGSRPLTVDMAVRLSRAFNNSVEFWLGLQRKCDIWDALHVNTAEYEHIRPIEKVA